MKQNNYPEIEQQLTPKCEFHASDDLMKKVMNSATLETESTVSKSRRFNWKA